MGRRWLRPAEWVATRRQMRPAQRAEPWTCAACGTYLMGVNHWHYTFRWLSGFREPKTQRGRAYLDIVLPDEPLTLQRDGIAVKVGKVVPRTDGSTLLRLRRKDLPR